MEIGSFEISHREGNARVGKLMTRHGAFETPAFMPVGTLGTVKGVSPRDLTELGAQIILANTYHLHLRPGDERIKALGGLHKFMGWKGPILTDSGGFQVFSLSRLTKITDRGVQFQSHLDGNLIEFTPEKVIRIQENLGVDIMMVLDECLEAGAPRARVEESWKRTLSWERACFAARRDPQQLLFGIVQGGMFEDLRVKAAEELQEIPFDGFAIGGLSVGESTEVMREMTAVSASALPQDKVRYLMGVGTPLDLVESVALGIDMFDCVIPTRSGRFGRVYVDEGYLNLRNTEFRDDENPIQTGCDCYACQHFSRAYISHLIHAKEMLGVQLATLHNLRFYQRLMNNIRVALRESRFQKWREDFVANYRSASEEGPRGEDRD